MPRQNPVDKIRRPDERFKDVAIDHSVRLWDCGHNGSLWVHPSAVISTPHGYGNIITTIQTSKGELVPITMYRYGHLVGVENSWLNIGFRPIRYVSPEWVCDTYR